MYIRTGLSLIHHSSNSGQIIAQGTATRIIHSTVDINASETVALNYPIAGGLSAAWQGATVNENGQIASPSISEKDPNTLELSQKVYGVLDYSYTAQFHVFRLQGVDLAITRAQIRAIVT